MENSWKIVVFILCLVFSAMFSASETALMSLSKIRLKQLAESNDKQARRISKLLEEPSRLLSSILIGNNLVNIGASALLTSIVIEKYGNSGVGIATGLMTLLVLIFGEITPKSLAAQNAEKIARALSLFVQINMWIFTPFIFILSKITDFLILVLGGDAGASQPFITEDELKTIVGVSHSEGVIECEARDIIYNVFDFDDSQVKDVMVARTEMVAINIDSSYEEVIEVLRQEQYSRIPVYEGTKDDIVGILYAKDLLIYGEEMRDKFELRKIIREPYFTYEFKPTKDLFKEMRAKRVLLAIALDEYAGTAGMVTMEDLVEEIVGEIDDEYDSSEDEDIKQVTESEYLVKGSTRLDEANELLGIKIESDDYDSIGGFVIGLLDRIPEPKEEVEYNGLSFIVEEIDKNRIETIRVIKRNI